jgi:hypothetical protein
MWVLQNLLEISLNWNPEVGLSSVDVAADIKLLSILSAFYCFPKDYKIDKLMTR